MLRGWAVGPDWTTIELRCSALCSIRSCCPDGVLAGVRRNVRRGPGKKRSSDVWLHGNPDSETVYSQVIVGTLDVRGTSDILIRYMDLDDTPRYELYLVE
jgi:hypothetical protein